jgi:DNA-binding LacI/PurR family transcriptional regulator
MFENSLVDKKSSIPRHYQVREKIREVIGLNAFKKGNPLPSERKLCELFEVSRITIRRAIDDLEREGILEKVWGRGIYVLNPPKQTTKTKKIGVTIWAKETPYHPATMETLHGIAETLGNSGYNFEVIYLTKEQIKTSEYIKNLNPDILKGIIVTVQEISEEQLNIIEKKIPHFVFYNRQEKKNSVVMDYRQAGLEITKHLCSLGHKRIALINGPGEFYVSKEVFNGYEQALKEAGLKVIPELIKEGYYTSENGTLFTTQLFQQKVKPTAIIAGDDFMAMGVLKGIKNTGLNCPADISVASFNDFPFTEFTHPPLTSYKIPFFELGGELAQSMIDIINGQNFFRKVLRGELRIRESTAELKIKGSKLEREIERNSG